jgi:hypothetical protein
VRYDSKLIPQAIMLNFIIRFILRLIEASKLFSKAIIQSYYAKAGIVPRYYVWTLDIGVGSLKSFSVMQHIP